MDFEKKLKTRFYVAIIYVAVGIILIAGTNITRTENEFISSFGVILAVMGLARLRRYKLITRDAQSIKRAEIRENDERNIAIMNKARSITFMIYVLLSATAVIILSLFNIHEMARTISYSVFILVLIYWIVYWIVRKRS